MVTVKQLSGVKFRIEARHHSIVSDQPLDNGGTDEGMTPPELMLASLGGCAAFYAAQYLKARGLAGDGVEVTVAAEKLKSPARLGNFRIDVTSPVQLTAEQDQALLNSVRHCLIHNTLLTPAEIEVNLCVPVHVG